MFFLAKIATIVRLKKNNRSLTKRAYLFYKVYLFLQYLKEHEINLLLN